VNAANEAWTDAYAFPAGDRMGLIFRANGTYTVIFDDAAGQWSAEEDGAYSVSGGTLTIDGVSAPYSVSGDTLSIDGDIYIRTAVVIGVVPPTPGAYTLTVGKNIDAGGVVTRTPDQASYAAGTQVVVTAVANTGYTFSGWTGTQTSPNASLTVTVNSNMSLTANFTATAPAMYTLTANVSPAGSGSVFRNPSKDSYAAGTMVGITASPAATYKFSGWTGSITSAEAITEVKVDSNMVVTANFVPDEPPPPAAYTLTVSASPAAGGTVTRTPSQTSYAAGTQVVIAATAAADYTFSGWTGSQTSPNASLTVTVNSNMTMTANFTAKPAPADSVCRWEGGVTCFPIGSDGAETTKQCRDNDGEVVKSCDAPTSGVWCDWGPMTTTGKDGGGCWWNPNGSSRCVLDDGKVASTCRDERLVNAANEAWIDGNGYGLILMADGNVKHVEEREDGIATVVGSNLWNTSVVGSNNHLSIARNNVGIGEYRNKTGTYTVTANRNSFTWWSATFTRRAVVIAEGGSAAPPSLGKKRAGAR
jgi:uncharacterized repeat protein (TIGR02543 family)